MTPLDVIEDGIKGGDLGRVAEGFAAMTGRAVYPPEDYGSDASRLVEALQFYADPANWQPLGDEFEPRPCAIARDKGDVARVAIQQDEKTKWAAEQEAAATWAGKGLGPVGVQAVAEYWPPAQQVLTTVAVDLPHALATGGAETVVVQAAGPGVRVDPAQFVVRHNQPAQQEGGKRYARREPIKPGMVNTFKDDLTLETASLDFDRKVSHRVKPYPRREAAAVPPSVQVVCDRCAGTYATDPYDARPRAAGEDDERMSNICPGCIHKAVTRGE